MSGYPNTQNNAAAAIPVWVAAAPPAGSGPVPKGYQQITSTVSAVGLTVPAGATLAIVNVETQAVRWRDDGVDPTTTVGMPLPAGSTTPFSGDLAVVKFIAQVVGAVINVSYYG